MTHQKWDKKSDPQIFFAGILSVRRDPLSYIFWGCSFFSWLWAQHKSKSRNGSLFFLGRKPELWGQFILLSRIRSISKNGYGGRQKEVYLLKRCRLLTELSSRLGVREWKGTANFMSLTALLFHYRTLFQGSQDDGQHTKVHGGTQTLISNDYCAKTNKTTLKN